MLYQEMIDERAALTPADFAAAGVEAPDWSGDPVPSLETWRLWRAAEDKALSLKRAIADAASREPPR
jgi:hypothetical protein